MKLTNAAIQIRWKVALTAVAIAVAGFAAVASPAQAAEPNHCVVALPEQNVKCFATYQEAKAYVESVAEVNSPKDPASGQLRVATAAADRSAALLIFPTLLFIAYDWTNYNFLGGSLWVIGWNGNCTTPTTNIDYTMADLGSWNNRISSVRTYSNCWLKGFDGVNWTGASTGYAGTRNLVTLNDDINSVYIS